MYHYYLGIKAVTSKSPTAVSVLATRNTHYHVKCGLIVENSPNSAVNSYAIYYLVYLFIYLYSYIRLFYGIPENIDLWVCVQVQWWFEINSNISIPTGGIKSNSKIYFTVTVHCYNLLFLSRIRTPHWFSIGYNFFLFSLFDWHLL